MMTTLLERVKIAGKAEAINQIARLIGVCSNTTLARMWQFFEWLAPAEEDKVEARKVRWLIETGHPFTDWLRRISRELSPRCRRTLIANLYGHAWFLNKGGVRLEFREREGFDPPTFMVIDVTQKCNLKCLGCWAGAYGHEPDLDLGLIRRIIAEARNEMGMHFFVLTGGEPFMRKDLQGLYDEFEDCQFQLYTNGTLIGPREAERLGDAGNVMAMISVEGLSFATEARRGKGSWEKIRRAMDCLGKEGVAFGFSATASRHNAGDVVSDEFIDEMVKMGCLYGWYFQYVPIGRNPDVSLMVTAQQREHLRKRVYELRNTRPIFLVDFWNDGPEVQGCLAGGKRYLHINNRGDVEPCVFCHFAVDNIRDKTLTEALCSAFFRDIRAGIPYDGNYLRSCMLIDRPEVFRAHYRKHRPRATHQGGETFVTELADDLDRNAREVAQLFDKAWEDGDWLKLYPDPPDEILRRSGSGRQDGPRDGDEPRSKLDAVYSRMK